MFDDLKPYPEVRSSRLPWAASLPSHWEERSLKSTTAAVVGGATPRSDASEFWDGDVAWATPMDVSRASRLRATLRTLTDVGLESTSARKVPAGSVILTSRAPVGNTAIADVELATNQGCKAIVPLPDVSDSEFLQHVLATARTWIEATATGTTFLEVSTADVASMQVPLPPIDEQRAIVTYLAHAHRRINKAIALKQRLLALLAEMQRHTLEQCFARGSVEAPSVRLKYIADIQTGLTLGKDYGDAELEAHPYLRVANVQAGSLALDKVAEVRVPHAEAERSTLRPGDLLVTEGGDIDKLGRGTIWNGEIDRCLHQNHIFAVRASDRINPRYLEIFLQHSAARRYFHITAKKTTNLASTNSTTLGNLRVPLPDLAAQKQVVAEYTARTDVLMREAALARREIALLNEFRTRLTSDAVTGQVDVRHIAAALPPIDPAEAFASAPVAIGQEGQAEAEAEEADVA